MKEIFDDKKQCCILVMYHNTKQNPSNRNYSKQYPCKKLSTMSIPPTSTSLGHYRPHTCSTELTFL